MRWSEGYFPRGVYWSSHPNCQHGHKTRWVDPYAPNGKRWHMIQATRNPLSVMFSLSTLARTSLAHRFSHSITNQKCWSHGGTLLKRLIPTLWLDTTSRVSISLTSWIAQRLWKRPDSLSWGEWKVRTCWFNVIGFLITNILGMKTETKSTHFSSKAYGQRDSKDTPLSGRLQLDVLQFMQREHKLRSYTLNSVCAQFLGEQKEDVHHSVISDLQNGTPESRRRLAVYCLKVRRTWFANCSLTERDI